MNISSNIPLNQHLDDPSLEMVKEMAPLLCAWAIPPQSERIGVSLFDMPDPFDVLEGKDDGWPTLEQAQEMSNRSDRAYEAAIAGLPPVFPDN